MRPDAFYDRFTVMSVGSNPGHPRAYPVVRGVTFARATEGARRLGDEYGLVCNIRKCPFYA